MTEQVIIKSQKKSKIKIEIGDKFSRWTVLDNMCRIKNRSFFRCECECGKIRSVWAYDLHSGHTKSCGCFRKEQRTTHGMAGTPEYKTWHAMIRRCTNPKDSGYKNYGGRGITVCTRWLKFENFLEDMGEKPEELTIERLDNNKGYYKENCIYTTCTEQSHNTRIQKNNKTGVNGCFFDKISQKYCVQIRANRKRYHVGLFKNLADAKAARIAAEKKYWGKGVQDAVN